MTAKTKTKKTNRVPKIEFCEVWQALQKKGVPVDDVVKEFRKRGYTISKAACMSRAHEYRKKKVPLGKFKTGGAHKYDWASLADRVKKSGGAVAKKKAPKKKTKSKKAKAKTAPKRAAKKPTPIKSKTRRAVTKKLRPKSVVKTAPKVEASQAAA